MGCLFCFVALGVSGGPDSMALCVLTANWKINGLDVSRDSDGFIDGILAIVVDHSLRAESKEEADMVSHRVSRIGTFEFCRYNFLVLINKVVFEVINWGNSLWIIQVEVKNC